MCDATTGKICSLAGVFEHRRTATVSSPRKTSKRGIEGSNPSSSASEISCLQDKCVQRSINLYGPYLHEWEISEGSSRNLQSAGSKRKASPDCASVDKNNQCPLGRASD